MGVLNDFLDEDKDSYSCVCGMCGFPLTKYQVAADFAGTVVNYVEHVTVPGSFCLCASCLDKLVEYTNGEVSEAYRRVYIQAILTDQAERGEYNPFTTE